MTAAPEPERRVEEEVQQIAQEAATKFGTPMHFYTARRIAAALAAAEARGERRGIERARDVEEAAWALLARLSTVHYTIEATGQQQALESALSLPPAREAAAIESEIRATAYGVAGQARVLTDAREAAACGTCSVENGGDGHGTAWDVGPDGEPSGKPCPACTPEGGKK